MYNEEMGGLTDGLAQPIINALVPVMDQRIPVYMNQFWEEHKGQILFAFIGVMGVTFVLNYTATLIAIKSK